MWVFVCGALVGDWALEVFMVYWFAIGHIGVLTVCGCRVLFVIDNCLNLNLTCFVLIYFVLHI